MVLSTVRLILLLTLSSLYVHAQSVSISGYINDAQTGEALIGASIYDSYSRKGITSNNYGFYSISLAPGKTKLVVSYMGYSTQYVELDAITSSRINISLKPETSYLQEVTISAEKQEFQDKPISQINIPIARLKEVPTLFGEPDVLKSLMLMPGVSGAQEGTSGLLVRGGTPDENLILLDDAPVYNVNHLFGFTSIFNADALKNINMYKGAFPARYGGRLSSVLDISMKEGNNQKLEGQVSIGLIASRVLLEGPLFSKKPGKTSFLISGRSSYLGLFMLPGYSAFKKGNSSNYFNYWLYDANLKINHKFNDRSQLFFSMYNGYDYLRTYEGSSSEMSKTGLTWGNTTATMRFVHSLTPKLFLKSIATFSKYENEIDISHHLRNPEETKLNYFTSKSSIRDLAGKVNFDYYPTANHQVKFGIEAVHHTYRPTFINTSNYLHPDTLHKVNSSIPAQEFAAFAEDEIRITSRFKVHMGMRGVLFQSMDKPFYSLEPRVSGNYVLADGLVVKAGYSHMRQFIHLLTSNSIGLLNDIWVPATPNAPPSFSRQVVLGLNKSVADKNLELSIEGYYKTFNRLIDYKTGTNFLTSYNKGWESQIETNGIGQAYGIELFAHKKQGRFNGWASYTLAWNKRKFGGIDEGRWFAANFDRRHSLDLTGSYSISPKISVSGNWVLSSGQPVTVPIAIRRNFETGIYSMMIYGDRNNYRMPVYHRMDIAFNFTRTTSKGYQRTWNVGLYNAYNRANPYYLSIKKHQSMRMISGGDYEFVGNNFKLVSRAAFPLLPFVSYSFRF
jgi:hypothetical protein